MTRLNYFEDPDQEPSLRQENDDEVNEILNIEITQLRLMDNDTLQLLAEIAEGSTPEFQTQEMIRRGL